jgi:peroxiredoxin Q/BCP
MTILNVGDIAPAFVLNDQDGNRVALADFKGKKNIVLYFYPKAMTPGCTTQACGIRDNHNEFAQFQTVVLGVSPDPQARLKKFIDKYQLNFTLLSDEDHAVAEAYGAWGMKKFMGREYMGILRTTFIINKEGRLCYVMHRPNTKTHDNEVVSYIKENF